MRRFMCLLAALMLLVWSGVACAETATKARAVSLDTGINTVAAIADASTGDTATVSPQGYLKTVPFNEQSSGVLYVNTTILSGAGKLGTVSCSATTADTTLLIYDALTATGTPVVDVPMAVAKTVYTVPVNIEIATGITAVILNRSGQYSVTYDSD